MARQAALIGSRDLLDSLTRAAGMTEPEAARLCRLGFARRMAEAILAPADRLVEAARALDADVMRLSERFVLRPSRLMARLATVGAGGRGLPPAFCIAARRRRRRAFAPARCRLPLSTLRPVLRPAADLRRPPGGPAADRRRRASGRQRLLRRRRGGRRRVDAGLPPPRRVATIGWRREDAEGLVRTARERPARPIGVTCRLCERNDCAHRVHAPVTPPRRVAGSRRRPGNRIAELRTGC